MLAAGSAAACTLGRGIERGTFERMRTASLAIESAITAKEPLPRYRQLVTEYSAALAATKVSVRTEREQALLARYESARPRLEDIQRVWEARTARGETELLPISEPLAARLAREYDLPVNTNEPPSIYANEALQAIWAQARSTLEAANATLDGR